MLPNSLSRAAFLREVLGIVVSAVAGSTVAKDLAEKHKNNSGIKTIDFMLKKGAGAAPRPFILL